MDINRRIFLTSVSTLALAGCATDDGSGGSNVITPQRVRTVSTLAAYTTCKMQLMRDPASRPQLERIRTALNELQASQTWDIATLATIMLANSGELTSDEGQLILVGLPLFIDLVSGQQVDLKQYEFGRAAIEGVSAGFNLALGSTAYPAAQTGPDLTLLDLQKQAIAAR